MRASLSTASFFVVFLVVCWRRFGEEVLKFLQKELECSAVKYRAVIWLASKQAIPTRVFSVLQCFVSQVLLEQLFLRKDIHSLSLSLSLVVLCVESVIILRFLLLQSCCCFCKAECVFLLLLLIITIIITTIIMSLLCWIACF